MKIAFVYDAVYPWVKGGAEKRIFEIGKRCAKRGNEVHVFGIKWWQGPSVIRYENMMLHGVCSPMELYVNGRRDISEALIFSLKLLPHLIMEKFDVIDVSAFPYFPCFSAKLVSFARRTPMTVTWHEVWGEYWYEYLGPGGFFGKLVENMVAKLAARPIAVSALTGKGLESLGVRGRKIHIVPNGIDLKRIKEIMPSPDKCDLIFVGRLIREKNVDLMLEAVDHLRITLPHVQCHVIGGGPEKERLTGLAAKLGLLDNVKFFGFMEYDELIARIKSSGVLALPSSREGFGMAVLEAFACGVPVVTVKGEKNAASSLVDDGTGFVVDLDAREISEAVARLIKDPMLHERMAASAMARVQEYDWDRIVERLTCIYDDLLQYH
ncbi:MAG: glycosyltransferase family 4 protein [Candidatus Methanoperedens sp.]|nr:glycosyltransferase family 4 protein [Candidatus Methanoperedens sp.]MCZ7370276.1 glycosyltransferase family 4 protein [Candidatus Methanoperedens sp.]